jgi:hypothetical protein
MYQAYEPSLNYQSIEILTYRVRTFAILSGKLLNALIEAVFYLIRGVYLQVAPLGNTSRQM